MIVRHDIYISVICNKKASYVDFGYMLMEDFYINQSLSTNIKYTKRK